MAIKVSHVYSHCPCQWMVLFCVFAIFELSSHSAVRGQTVFHLDALDESGNSNDPYNWHRDLVSSSNQDVQELDMASNVRCDNKSNSTGLIFGSDEETQGTCFYDQEVTLGPEGLCGTYTSFGTLFQFQANYSSNTNSSSIQSGDKGLAFILRPAPGSVSNVFGAGAKLSLVFYFVEGYLNLGLEYKPPWSRSDKKPINLSLCSQDSTPCEYHGTNSKFAVWIEYFYPDQILSVLVGDIRKKPSEAPQQSTKLDLRKAFGGNISVGFSSRDILNYPGTSASLGNFSYDVFDWTFNSNGPPPDWPRDPTGSLLATVDPQSECDRDKSRERNLLIACIAIPSGLIFIFLLFVIYLLYKGNARLHVLAKKYKIEDIEALRRGVERFSFKALYAATKGFSSSELLGSGGFGSVYRGNLRRAGARKRTEVAVKRISASSGQGAREFEAEVQIIGQMRHRNLVRLLGWCLEREELLLVYELMHNGSLDQHLFWSINSRKATLTWNRRLNIVSGVATALAYLHEEWEQRVIHRDVKCSNIMLDRQFNARLGDFGLARSTSHSQEARSTDLAGTRGYLAPELGHTFKATKETDVYSFGAVILEVATGRRAFLELEDRRISDESFLVDYVWFLHQEGRLLEAADFRLESAYDRGEMVRLLKIGLLCSHPDPARRPKMREFPSIWTGAIPFPPLPTSKPFPVFVSTFDVAPIEEDESDNEIFSSFTMPREEELDETGPSNDSKSFESYPKLLLGHYLRSWSSPPLRNLYSPLPSLLKEHPVQLVRRFLRLHILG